MPSSVPPPDNNHAPTPTPLGQSGTKGDSFEDHAKAHGSGGGGMTEFMKLMTPEDRKKFMNILIQNLTGEMKKASDKIVQELKKEREDIEGGS